MPRLLHALAHHKHIFPSDSSSSHQDYNASMQDPNRLRSRLHALFHSKDNHPQDDDAQDSRQQRAIQAIDGDDWSGDGHDTSRSMSFSFSNGSEIGSTVAPPKPQREAIKVLVITWNMGDALPKGDLSVLLGKVPPYKPPQSPITGLPSLPIENAHPYHIVVIAGQECPTPSGAPRGLGGGLIKGVTLRHKKEIKEKKEKEKEIKEKDKEIKEEAIDLEKDAEDVVQGTKSPEIGGDDDDRLRATSPMTPHSPFLHRLSPAAKGWSQMLDDYFCGPNYRYDVPHSLPSSNPTSSRDSPVPAHKPNIQSPVPSPQPSAILRSSSVPMTPSNPVPTPLAKIAATNGKGNVPSPHGPSHLRPPLSPLATSRSSLESGSNTFINSSSDDSEDNGEDVVPYINPAGDKKLQQKPKALSSPSKQKLKRPEIVIPTEETKNDDQGAYVHVAKERLLGMYLSVYVYKDAEHLIQGLDKDFVTAGLAGGRFGNKGGIGISLKLADHRFLFVNSHLAAHTDRQAARLANIAKIKSELRLDCFLPKDDPRAQAEDIADRFDTVFWCGDLNFRLELSRLHADWLIEQKKYAEALMWDQLKMAMADPEINPFPGFEEGPINFPCTFKYDVWKSVRATNREIRRNLKRRKSSASAASVDIDSSQISSSNPGNGGGGGRKAGGHQKSLSGVPEADAIEEMGEETSASALAPADGMMSGQGPSPTSGQESDKDQLRPPSRSGDRSDEEDYGRQSFESSRYTSGVASTVGTDAEEDNSDADSEPRSHHSHNHRQHHHQQHKAFESALKEKTRHLLGLVKMDGILTGSPGRRNHNSNNSDNNNIGRRVSNRNRGESTSTARRERRKEEQDRNEYESRRASMSSFASTNIGTEYTTEPDIGRLSNSSYRSIRNPTASSQDDHLGIPSKTDRSVTSHSSASPPSYAGDWTKPPFTRRLSGMKRTSSSKSVYRELEEGEDLDNDLDVDRREGVYDSSKKQRVPSWCDRVLWKAHITPDPPLEPISEDHDPSLNHERPLSRISTAFSNFGGHFRLPMGRASTKEPSLLVPTSTRSGKKLEHAVKESDEDDHWGEKVDKALRFDADRNMSDSFVSSPPESPDLRSTGTESGLIPAPRQVSPLGKEQKFFSASKSIPPLLTPKMSPVKTESESSSPRITHSAPDPGKRKLSFDPTSSSPLKGTSTPPTDQSSHIDRVKSPASRPRSNSDSTGDQGVEQEKEKKKGRVSDGIVGALATPTKIETKLSVMGRGNGASPRNKSPKGTDSPTRAATWQPLQSSKTESATNTAETPLPPIHSKSYAPSRPTSSNMDSNPSFQPLTHATTLAGPAPTVSNRREHDKNAFMRFLRDLPGWLHRSDRSTEEEKDKDETGEELNQEEKRWQKGEVRCLHYGTIDDAGMRLLEGRSDHRPAIFAGAVYI